VNLDDDDAAAEEASDDDATGPVSGGDPSPQPN